MPPSTRKKGDAEPALKHGGIKPMMHHDVVIFVYVIYIYIRGGRHLLHFQKNRQI